MIKTKKLKVTYKTLLHSFQMCNILLYITKLLLLNLQAYIQSQAKVKIRITIKSNKD